MDPQYGNTDSECPAELKAKRERFIQDRAQRARRRRGDSREPAGGARRRARDGTGQSDGRAAQHAGEDRCVRDAPDIMTRARAYASERKVSIEEAMVAVVRDEPALMQ